MPNESARLPPPDEEATAIISGMKECVRETWYATAREKGATARDSQPISRASPMPVSICRYHPTIAETLGLYFSAFSIAASSSSPSSCS